MWNELYETEGKSYDEIQIIALKVRRKEGKSLFRKKNIEFDVRGISSLYPTLYLFLAYSLSPFFSLCFPIRQ